MQISGLIRKLLAGTANLLNKYSKTQGWGIVVVFENGKATGVVI